MASTGGNIKVGGFDPTFGSLRGVSVTPGVMDNNGQWYQIPNLLAHSVSNGMDANAVAGTITVIADGDYEVDFDDSFTSDRNGIIDGAVFVDSVESIISWQRTIGGPQVGSVSQGDFLSLNAGQILTIWTKSSVDNTTLVHERIGFRAKRIG